MRVISGIYKGKKLLGFDIEGTRPTMDRVKESMFGMIQNYIDGSVVLDLFAGTGALGIEALSNGASYCYFIDNNKIAINTINKNTEGIDNKKIIFTDSYSFIKNTDIKFDLIFLDPPYKYDLTPIIQIIKERNLLSENGVLVCESELDFDCVYSLQKEKKYSEKMVKIYKNS